jgi:hypothetical protein
MSDCIQVQMEVTRRIRRESFVEVWGHVGDYEVMVCLALNDPRASGLPYLPAEFRHLGEGPWDTRRDAIEFGRAKVGVWWRVIKQMGKWYIIVRDE